MKDYQITTEALQLLTGGDAHSYRLLPFKLENNTLYCYGEEGREHETAAVEVEVLTGRKIEVTPIESAEFAHLLGHYYRKDSNGKSTVQVFKLALSRGQDFLFGLIENAFQEQASDIHLEPYEDRCRVRFRIDGKLLERHVIEKGNYAALVNQVKILANLDISEKRLPQDGRILHHSGDHRFDVRVSSLPTIHGEKVVMRLLTRRIELLELCNLGFDQRQLDAYLEAIRHPHGLVLISGPTGSGKSTTLYATLRLLNDITGNILTIEDPVEYTLEGINQVQLKEEIGLTFTSALRTFLRQDPDIIMLGEIRDADTAQMAIRSSLTGHLIFSTIHTNSAWGSVSRLIDMGVHPYLISDTLILCMAQRLVRLLCPHCKSEMIVDESIKLQLGEDFKGDRLYRPVGCEHCYYTGYSGRKAVYEVIPMDEELAKAIRSVESDVTPLLKKREIKTLKMSALELLEQGQTSLEEVVAFLNL